MKNRTIKGVDSASPVTAAAAAALYADGVRFSGRYLVPVYYAKALSKYEAGIIRSAGLALLLIWETSADRAKGGYAAGKQDGETAYRLAREMGVPAGTAIYFAVDYCPIDSEYDAIAAYIRAAGNACKEYEAGVYGSYYVVEAMAERGACGKFWQFVGGSGGKVSEKAQVYQYQGQNGLEAQITAKKAGFAVDMNSCTDMAEAGFWMPEAEKEPEGKEEPAPWYAEAMAWAESEGLIQDGRPNDPVTRAELATVFYRKFGPGGEKSVKTTEEA